MGFILLHQDRWLSQLQTMQKHWKSFRFLTENAARFAKWAMSLNFDGTLCYVYTMLLAYASKLSFQPSKSGTMRRILEIRKRKPLRVQQQLAPNETLELRYGSEVNIIMEEVVYEGRHLIVESVQLPQAPN